VFSTSGQYLYVATGQPEAIVRRLDVQTWEVKVVFREADEKALARFLAPNIYGLAIAPDDRTLAICLGDGTVLFDLASETTNFAINNGRAGASILAFSPNGSLLAKATRTAELWDPATRQLHAAYPTGMVTALAFSPRRMLLVTLGEGLLGRPGRADVWSVKDGEHLVTFPCHTDAITAMVFVPGTESIITGSCDGNVAIWDLSRFAQGVPEWQGIKPADKSNDK
jgi:WD40 repeat protein